MGKRSVRALIGAMCGALLLGFVPSLASASTPPTFPDPQGDSVVPVLVATTPLGAGIRWIGVALAEREKTLGQLANSVATAPMANPTDRATISALVASSASGISALLTATKSATSIAEINSDAAEMIVNYRVFSLVRVEVNMLLRTELRLKGLHAIDAVEPGLEAAISTEHSIGLNVSAIERRFNALSSSTTLLGDVLNTTETSLLDLTPADYPAATVFSDASNVLNTALSRLQKLEIKVRAIVQSLSQLRTEKSTSKHLAKAELSTIFNRIDGFLSSL